MSEVPAPSDPAYVSQNEVLGPDGEFRTVKQDPQHLLRALTVALQALGKEGDQVAALRESFALVKSGLDADRALLLYIREGEKPEILYSNLTFEQARACVEMRSSEGVSPTVIRHVIETQEPVFIENSQNRDKQSPARSTLSLDGGAHSVIAAPVVDPTTKLTIAVLYLENKGLLKRFEHGDLAYLIAYTSVLAQGFGLHLSHTVRTQRAEQAAAAASAEAANLRKQVVDGAPELIGDSHFIRDLQDRLNEVFIPYAETDNPKPIAIFGDSGAGKELIARYLHYYSQRRSRHPFVAVNCAVLRGDMAISTLFGHKRGAFTGAVDDQKGKFRAAHEGTLFLDEVGELHLDAQAMLLRVIEEHHVYPLGDANTKGYPVDVQLVVATNRDLEERVKEGHFRGDLLSRLNAFKILLRPLGSIERRSDIRPLLMHFLAKHEKAMRKKTKGLSPEASRALLSYSWPGNVREIDNVCTSLIAHARPGETIELSAIKNLWPQVLDGPRHPEPPGLFDDDMITLEQAKEILERELLIRRFERYDRDAKKVGASLGLGKSSTYRLAEKHGIKLRRSEDESEE